MRPTAAIARAYLVRGLRLWIATRVFLGVAFLFGQADPLHLSSPAAASVVLLSILICLAETHRRRERALLGNLGVGMAMLLVLFALPALAGEVALRLAAGAI